MMVKKYEIENTAGLSRKIYVLENIHEAIEISDGTGGGVVVDKDAACDVYRALKDILGVVDY